MAAWSARGPFAFRPSLFPFRPGSLALFFGVGLLVDVAAVLLVQVALTGVLALLLAHAALLRNFAVRWGLPEHMVTGSAENNNYASILEAGSPFHKACEAAQHEDGAE